ncbi:MAG: antitoxin of toxin-antitoxin stability system [Mesorhizobium sp.]|nr:antitoxin of toxin-antitoxin stability system [Mesorhizobium sp.]MCO5160549.1 antitoxin of toxin-antitoxin stability system [Mesorhizobium sp.]
MAKEAVFTMKLEPELRDAFMAAAKHDGRSASQIVRGLMRAFVNQDREYVSWLQGKVDEAQADIEAGRIYTQEEVEAHMDRLFADLERKGREAAE